MTKTIDFTVNGDIKVSITGDLFDLKMTLPELPHQEALRLIHKIDQLITDSLIPVGTNSEAQVLEKV